MERKNNILEKWEDCPLSDCVKIIGGGTPKTTKKEYWNGNIPWLSVVDFNNDNRWVINTEKNITKLGLDESSTKLLGKGDVIISARGTVGVLAQLKHPMAFNQSCYGISIKEDKTNEDFLYYILKYSIEKIKRNVHGAVFDTITRQTFDFINILLPPLSEQKAIARVLSAFDDKIELLQAQNKTLETMAQTIFKEWFGKYQIGDELPEGWSFSTLYSIARYINGSAFKAQDFSKDKTGLPIVKIAELKNGITDSTAFTKKVVDNKYYIDDGDILFSWSGSPETSIDIFLWSSGKAILNQHSFNVKVDDDNEKAWVYFLLKYKKSLFIHLAKMKQTTGLGHVTISDLKENYFATPPKDDRKRFGKVFNGFHQKILKNQSQIQSLTKTRDTLLPKLMSGQVRVKNLKQTADA